MQVLSPYILRKKSETGELFLINSIIYRLIKLLYSLSWS